MRFFAFSLEERPEALSPFASLTRLAAPATWPRTTRSIGFKRSTMDGTAAQAANFTNEFQSTVTFCGPVSSASRLGTLQESHAPEPQRLPPTLAEYELLGIRARTVLNHQRPAGSQHRRIRKAQPLRPLIVQ